MKRYIFISLFLICALYWTKLYSQNAPTYKIPSFNVQVEGVARFSEGSHQFQDKERRQVNVQVKSTAGKENCQLVVYVYSLDESTILGPFVINESIVLEVDVDQRSWGVIVDSDMEVVLVDVWFDKDGVSSGNAK